jgi:hypothetical protein
MSGSSILVALNALALKRLRLPRGDSREAEESAFTRRRQREVA